MATSVRTRRRRHLPPYTRVEGVPGNESLEHFVLKWAAYRVLTHDLECSFALLEAGARPDIRSRRRWPRHDALGVRFRTGRASLPWQEVPASTVRLEVLDGDTGRWREVPAADLGRYSADPTLRARRLGPGSAQATLRHIRPGRTPGTVLLRDAGGERRQVAQLCAADAKQSRSDLQAWLREAPDRLRGVQYFLIVAPVGLTDPGELPPKVGLAEVDTHHLVGEGGAPAVRMARWPEALRTGVRWDERRTAEFERHAYYAMHDLFERRLFWFLAQQALDRRHAAGSGEAAAAVARLDLPTPEGVRAYRPEDRQAVVDLWVRTGIARPWNDLGAEIDLQRRHYPDLLLVADAPDEPVVGAVMGGWDGRRGWVYHLAVDAGHRRRGVARALLAALEARLGAMGAPKVNLMVRGDNLGVLDFYSRAGYGPEDARLLSKWLLPPASPGSAAPAARPPAGPPGGTRPH